jgi:hypothetical protein
VSRPGPPGPPGNAGQRESPGTRAHERKPPRKCGEPRPGRGGGSRGPRQCAVRRLRGRRPAWPDPTCGWRPGSCG